MTDASPHRALCALLAVAALSGCSDLDNCPDAQAPITIELGDNAMSDPATLRYESAPWNGPLDAFPAKTELIFKHDLGVTPLEVKAYLAFAKDGANGSGGGSLAESAGNQDLIECVDSHVIVLKNDTCERGFFVKVVASGQSFEDNGSSCTD